MRITKNICCIILLGVLSISLTACACKHEWINATCSAPVTCTKCGETAGDPLAHVWADPNCVEPKTCVTCSATEGEALGHEWQNATCVSPAICKNCEVTDGEALGHNWTDATCTNPKTCSVCSCTEGEANGHSWKDATYSAPKTCSACGKTEGNKLSKPSNNSENSGSGSSNTRTCLYCSAKVSRSQTLYCSHHDCAQTNCSYPAKCVNGYIWGSYCEFHSCRHDGCTSMPIGGTNYCGAHND